MKEKILFITLSNIGDVVLSLPLLDYLRMNFPGAEISVLCAPRPKQLFAGNPKIKNLIVYDKHCRLREKIELFNSLKKEGFRIVVDLRNSLFGFLLPAKNKTSPFNFIPKGIVHMKQRHLYKFKIPAFLECGGGLKEGAVKDNDWTGSLYISDEDKDYVDGILKANKINSGDKIIIVSAGARSEIKRWQKEKFASLIGILSQRGKKIILTGDKDDAKINNFISSKAGAGVLDLSQKTSLSQLAYLIKRAQAVVTNDSAMLHLASYLNAKVIAIFGPTDDAKYGPWSDNCAVVKKEVFCRPCGKAQCRYGALECMNLIGVSDVLRKIDSLLLGEKPPEPRHEFKRILITRTDRIGDVILSTPVIKEMRSAYPDSYIAMIARPFAKDILEANPSLDKLIVYDKRIKYKGLLANIKFALYLRGMKFDLALILHPTNRMHLISFFSGIKKRVGYGRKFGFLLTDRIEHTKQLGLKHELEYNLDLLRYLGIGIKGWETEIPVKEASEEWVKELFEREGISPGEPVLAIHPGASCISKIWPLSRFSETADRLADKYGFKVFVVAGPSDTARAEQVVKKMRSPSINLCGKLSISQLASVIKRCSLFISNDSGPVHIASAIGTPVIAIFGRNQKGLSPQRWRPLGKMASFIHKPAGCIECLAHNCQKKFLCLDSIGVDDVVKAADSLLNI